MSGLEECTNPQCRDYPNKHYGSCTLRKNDATQIPAGCAWDGPADQRTLNHVMDCPVCSNLWPLIAQEMRRAKGRQLPTDDPRYIGENVGYRDK